MKDSLNPQVFIAHANEDKHIVRNLYESLKQSGFNPWLDEKDLLGGQQWPDEIPNALKRSHFFIACLSSESISKRGYVQREFRQALNLLAEMPAGTIYLIPLKLDDCEIPDLRQNEYGINLRDVQWINYWEEDGYKKLITSIKYQWEKQENHFSESRFESPTKNIFMGKELVYYQKQWDNKHNLRVTLSIDIDRLIEVHNKTCDEDKKISLEHSIAEKKNSLFTLDREMGVILIKIKDIEKKLVETQINK